MLRLISSFKFGTKICTSHSCLIGTAGVLRELLLLFL